MGSINDMLPVILPLLFIQLVLIAVALFDLSHSDRAVRGGSKGLWAILIVFLSLIGPALYFTLGREDA